MEPVIQLSETEKKAYVERIEKKATDENISIKHAIQKLGGKQWAYYKYKAELRKLDSDRCRSSTSVSKDQSVEEHRTPMPISVTLSIAPDVNEFLEKEAVKYATEADFIAQLLLHDCIRSKINAAKVKEVLT